MSAAAIVPAYNEEGRVGATVRALLGSGAVDRVVVVDDGSTDRTGLEAGREGAEVIALETNMGKGAALKAGLASVDAPVYLLADADLQQSAGRLGALVDAVHGGADIAIAQFDVAGGFGLAKGIARYGIWRLAGQDMKSPLSGQRALAKRALEAVWPLPEGWGVEVAMTVRALWSGLKVVEVPLALEHRATGRDVQGFLHRGKQCIAVASTLLRLGACAKGRGRRG